MRVTKVQIVTEAVIRCGGIATTAQVAGAAAMTSNEASSFLGHAAAKQLVYRKDSIIKNGKRMYIWAVTDKAKAASKTPEPVREYLCPEPRVHSRTTNKRSVVSLLRVALDSIEEALEIALSEERRDSEITAALDLLQESLGGKKK